MDIWTWTIEYPSAVLFFLSYGEPTTCLVLIEQWICCCTVRGGSFASTFQKCPVKTEAVTSFAPREVTCINFIKVAYDGMWKW